MKSLEYMELHGLYCAEEDTEIIKLTRTKKPTWYKKKEDGTIVPLKQIHKRSYKDVIIGMLENDLERKELSVVEETIHDGKHESPRIRIIIKKDGVKQTSVILSQSQAAELINAIHENFYDVLEIPPESPILEMSNETKIIIALFNSPYFTITVNDLLKFGIDRRIANQSIKRMITKNILQRCGKIGHSHLYTATCSKDELRKLFGGT